VFAHLGNIDPIVFLFALGAFASWAKSDLEIPEPISKFLSVFLLLSIGIKGGHEIRVAETFDGLLPVLALGLFFCLAIPGYLFLVLKKKLGPADAAALAACYGSVSAVTFIVAQNLLEAENLAASGFMVAVMALMEIPAIVLALALYRRAVSGSKHGSDGIRVFSAKSVILLIGGLLVGVLMNERSWDSVQPVVQSSFKGCLMFFLLDLGIVAQKHFRSAFKVAGTAIVVGCVLPLLNGIIAVLLASYLGVSSGDAVLLAALASSGSYIAAPAAIRSAIPEAKPSFYVALPLALTFPINVVLGIPLYIEITTLLR